MYNSGLVAATRRHIPMLKAAVELIDALIDAGLNQFNIEQIALSEAFRLHGEPIAEMKPWFEHYFRRSQKLYMRPRIAERWAREGAWKPLKPFLEPSKLRVRSARICDKLMLRLRCLAHLPYAVQFAYILVLPSCIFASQKRRDVARNSPGFRFEERSEDQSARN